MARGGGPEREKRPLRTAAGVVGRIARKAVNCGDGRWVRAAFYSALVAKAETLSATNWRVDMSSGSM